MSLLSVDITKVKRLSLRGIRLPAPTLPKEPSTLSPAEPRAQVNRLPSQEEIEYNQLLSTYPIFKILVETLDLVSPTTGDRIKTLDTPPPSPINKPTLEALAQSLLRPENSYTPEQVIQKIIEDKGVSRTRAERGFKLLVESRALEPLPSGKYMLANSTPF